MKRHLATAFAGVAALIVSPLVSSASDEHKPRCMSLEKAQKLVGKSASVRPMTPIQFRFLQGFYVAQPTTPPGLPPGDGALLLTADSGDGGAILWTRGKLVCDPTPLAGDIKEFLKVLAGVKAGAGADGDDL